MKKRNSRRSRAGLTLMEVMLVLVILGILGSMAAMFVSGAQKNAMRRTTRAEISSFATALDRYHLDMLSYPSGQDGLQALVSPPSNDQSNRWAGPYIKTNNDLKDPWGNDYQYEQTNNSSGNQGGASFTIKSAGPDGSVGTEDDVSSDDQF